MTHLSSPTMLRSALFVLSLLGLGFVPSACVSSLMISHRSTRPSIEGSISSVQRIDLESRFSFSEPVTMMTGSSKIPTQSLLP